MIVPASSFQVWWAEFQKEVDELRDSYHSARRIRRHLRSLSADEQEPFLNELLYTLLRERHAYGISLFLLEGITDPRYLRTFARHLDPLPGAQDADEEAHLADLIRILAAADNDESSPVITSYLLQREIGPYWSTVPWALWPHRKELFARAWTRYFLQQEPASWESTLVIKAFLGEPDAIAIVRDELRVASAERWEALVEAILRQAGIASWLSPDQHSALDRSLQ